MMRACPVCESENTSAGFNHSERGAEGRIDHATASCHDCGALWKEAFYRRSGETVISDIRPHALAASNLLPVGNIPTNEAQACSHSDNQGEGCPNCGAIHIGVKPHGAFAASCLCIDCGTTWDHRYDAIERIAYRSNIKTPVRQ